MRAIPHCSSCFQDFGAGDGPAQPMCGHLVCVQCLSEHHSPYVCPVDGTTTEVQSVLLRSDIARKIAGEEDCFEDVNTQGVLCKYMHRGVQCPDGIACRYLHGLPRQLTTSDFLECEKCMIRLPTGKNVCPFCKSAGVRPGYVPQAESPPPGFRQSQAESLTSSADMMKSMDPVFPEFVTSQQKVLSEAKEEAKASAKDFNILQSYVDLAMTDSDEEVEEEVVVIPPATKVALLQLLRSLWQFFRQSAVSLISRLTRRPDSTMVFYE